MPIVDYPICRFRFPGSLEEIGLRFEERSNGGRLGGHVNWWLSSLRRQEGYVWRTRSMLDTRSWHCVKHWSRDRTLNPYFAVLRWCGGELILTYILYSFFEGMSISAFSRFISNIFF